VALADAPSPGTVLGPYTLEKLLVYCSNNPTVGVLTAADEVMGGDSGN